MPACAGITRWHDRCPCAADDPVAAAARLAPAYCFARVTICVGLTNCKAISSQISVVIM